MNHPCQKLLELEARLKLVEEKSEAKIRLGEEKSEAKIKMVEKEKAETNRERLGILEHAKARRTRKRARKARKNRVSEHVPEKKARKDTEPRKRLQDRPPSGTAFKSLEEPKKDVKKLHQGREPVRVK